MERSDELMLLQSNEIRSEERREPVPPPGRPLPLPCSPLLCHSRTRRQSLHSTFSSTKRFHGVWRVGVWGSSVGRRFLNEKATKAEWRSLSGPRGPPLPGSRRGDGEVSEVEGDDQKQTETDASPRIQDHQDDERDLSDSGSETTAQKAKDPTLL